jgi:hypothetical protein
VGEKKLHLNGSATQAALSRPKKESQTSNEEAGARSKKHFEQLLLLQLFVNGEIHLNFVLENNSLRLNRLN